ncbi:uncharacterized protein LOC105187375 isoform X1 [Harpegnathos saltator]|uniref:uncharacterized protein LOC105187375 isoform X1 n=1 Tax=Harpegnathos saltator TaxID=610380 RepID=UPI000DBEDDA1|nr:uncharacterized protein LOC105187375 isoform X1 [Harpegnathos saltator]
MPGSATTTMEADANISDILREVITFLESLRDTQLPLALESLREKLLVRSKDILTASATSSSPEPYLNMNSGPKTILLTKNDADTEEYVGMEEPPQKNHQDYYETFEHESEPKTLASVAQNEQTEMQNAQDTRNHGENSQELLNIYKNLSAAQSKNKCHKCGPLHRKEGKKLFMSDNRACWIALMGSHLLIYRSERHGRPSAIYPIRGYMARPATSLLPRDRQKSDLAFEMYCPGSETLQFIARTPKDTAQWIAKVCEVGGGKEEAASDEAARDHGISKNNKATSESPVRHREGHATSPRRQNPKSADNAKKSTAKAKSNRNDAGKHNSVENPPPLPARIPRRLPSVPSDSVPTYRAIEDYDDDDDIYHKIEDLNNGMAYQNVMLAKTQRANVSDKEHEDAAGHNGTSKEGKEGRIQEKSDAVSVEEELYDDIFVTSQTKASGNEEEKALDGDRPVDDGEESFYDDVENLLGRSTKDHRAKDQTEASSNKFLQKKSFLERVWSRRESPGKTDKRLQSKVSASPTPSSSATETPLPTYDDVSEWTLIPSGQESSANDGGEELPEYNCPPPPRPVYTKSPIVKQVESYSGEEFYDDVNACREQYNKNHQQTALQSTRGSSANAREAKDDRTEPRTNGELPEEEVEHYQSPRSELRVHEAPEYQNEELYDDIALCANFKARQRDANENKDSEDGKSTVGSDKKSWNRFSMNKKLPGLAETNRRNANECEEIDDPAEANNASKRNTFQKLISKMENSLSKVSVRGPNSLPISKPSTASNNS